MSPEPESTDGVPCTGRLRLRSPRLELTLPDCRIVVGEGEIFVPLAEPLDLGTLVRFDLRSDEGEAPLLAGLGRVRWRREDHGEDSPAGIGLELLRVDERSRSTIEEILASRPPGPPASPGGHPALGPSGGPTSPDGGDLGSASARGGSEPAGPPRSPQEAEVLARAEADEGSWGPKASSPRPSSRRARPGIGDREPPRRARPPSSGRFDPEAETLPPPPEPVAQRLTPVQAADLAGAEAAQLGPVEAPARRPEGSGAARTVPDPLALDAIVTVDGQGRIVGWSPAAARLFGYEAEAAVGRPLTVLVPDRRRDELTERLGAHVVAGGDESRRTLTGPALRADGTEFWAEVALGPWEAHGRTYWSAVVREVSGGTTDDRGAPSPGPLVHATSDGAADAEPSPSPAGGAPAADAPRARRPRAPGARVLLAAEDPAIRSMVQECARQAVEGSRVWAAADALAALAMARSAPPLVMVAPLDDPELNGLELAAALRGDPQLASVQLVLTVGEMSPGDRAILEAMGVRHVVERPITAAAMTEAIARAADDARR